MIESILTTICKLKGVHYACLYREGKGMSSTFPDNDENILSVAKNIEQIFFALQAIDKSHDEISFSVDDKFIVAYLLYDSYIAILQTDKKVNFPLIHMGIYSASTKIKANLAKSNNSLKEQQVSSSPLIESSEKKNGLDSPFESKMEPIMSLLLDELINYFGPAAKFVLEDAIIQWETNYVKSMGNLPELGDILLNELETAHEKDEFSQFIKKMLK